MSETKVCEWTESPFTAYDKRNWRFRHRIIIESFRGAGVDVRHDKRLEKGGYDKEEWKTIEVYEARQHGVQHVTAGDVHG